MKNLAILFSFGSLLLLNACKPDDVIVDNPPADTGYSTGAFVVNEGSFLQNNASITHVAEDGTVTNDVYYAQNQVELGDVLQSFTVIGDRGYAVLNNSQKVEVVDMVTMKHAGAISGLSYPRFMVSAGNNKAFVSNGSTDGTIEVVDLASNQIESSIAVGKGPQRMGVYGNDVWVCNEGGWTLDSTITIVNAASHNVIDTVFVGHRPSDIVFDQLGYAWVLCAGETFYDANWAVVGHSLAKLYRIDVAAHAVVSSIPVGLPGDHPTQLEISPDGQVLYYENNGVYRFDFVNADFPGDLIIGEARTALRIQPSTGQLWCASISDFTNPSTVYVYSATGAPVKSFTAGIGTNGIEFQ